IRGSPDCTARRRTAGTIPTPGRPSRKPPGLLQDGGPEGLLLTFPLRAVFEQVLASLDLLLAPPALGVLSSTGGAGR
ncbi:MAG TPA: hypothetical protein VMR98_01225, partial [Candidatus Polarisedimenticolaceae bacterium]|nr:hypothetical protein [Candidatus Polarisedimenticolaceae bacterium]